MRVDRPLHEGRVLYLQVGSDVLEVLLDAPQRVGTLPQLGHLGVGQGHVDHAAHAGAVQHAGQRQEDLLANTIHVLRKHAHTYAELGGGEALRHSQTLTQYIGI